MHTYANLTGESGVTAYQLGEDYIRVRFQDGGIYRYDYRSTGLARVEYMKGLAIGGAGLASYISQNVGDAYASREH